MRNFNEYLQRKQGEFGEKFDPSSLSKQFIEYYENQKRVEVELELFKEVKRGRIGVTTGWKPAFLLMLTRRSVGSIYLLSDEDKILRTVSE